MANKKLLICAALATGLLLTACVKKEEPKNEEQPEQTTTEAQPQPQPEPEKIQEFESLESVDKQEAPAPAVETTREETANTTTEIRRETRPVQRETPATTSETPRTEQPKPAKTEQPKAEPKPVKVEQPKAEAKPAKTEQPKAEQTAKAPKSSTPAQSEDDAVAAAIAAATPALNN